MSFLEQLEAHAEPGVDAGRPLVERHERLAVDLTGARWHSRRRCATLMQMPRTTVDVDERALAAAREALGTRGLSATVNSALREVAARRALADFDVLRDIDGTPEEIAAGREERGPGGR